MKKLILAIAFIGMGSFAMAQQTVPQDKKMTKEEMHKKMEQREQARMQEMQKELNLNQSQVSQIKDLHAKRKAEMKVKFEKDSVARQAMREEMKAKKLQMNDDMKKILSAEQFSKWEATNKAKMDQRRAMMKEKGMKGKRNIMKHGLKEASQSQVN
ncbi:hypothetical protein [Chryseobacterium sp.]|uniref:hypothetical protein n=1 Tax=Chryseobacterium sp. TaxID=1871047 RepID=UPI00388E98CB